MPGGSFLRGKKEEQREEEKKTGRFLSEDALRWMAALVIFALVMAGSRQLSRFTGQEKIKRGNVEVMLDSGHGGSDPGKIGVNGEKEKEINLQITQKIRQRLEEKNISVELTKTNEEGTGKGKTEEMQERVKRINEIQPMLTVSIHQNSYPDEEVKGAQTFYYTHSEASEKAARILQEALRKIDPENHRKSKANDTYYLLKRTKVPVVIVECGFLSNPEEARKLSEEAYQEKVAEAVTEGILQCLREMEN